MKKNKFDDYANFDDVVKQLLAVNIEKRMISIGCRTRQVRNGAVGVDLNVPEWSNEFPDRFLKANVMNIPFEDKFFGEVYASHVFEHFGKYKNQRNKALKEWWRLLSVGGIMKIIVPNNYAYVRECYEGRWSAKTFSDMMFGSQNAPYENHFYSYSEETLAEVIRDTLGAENYTVESISTGRRGRWPIPDLELRYFIRKTNKGRK